MAKKYTFTVTTTLCEEDENVTREEALESLKDWLGVLEYSGFPGSSESDKIEIK